MPSAQTLISPLVDVDFGRLDAKMRFEAWQSFNSNTFRVRLLNHRPEEFRGSSRTWRAGPFIVSRTSHLPVYQVRDSPLLKQWQEEFVIVRLPLKGTCKMISGNSDVALGPGALHLYDAMREHVSVNEELNLLSIGIPYAAIGYDPSRHPYHVAFSSQNPIGRMLVATFQAMHEVVPSSTQHQALQVAEAFVAMLRAFLVQEFPDNGNREKFQRGREIAVRRYIAEHISEPGLKATSVCAAMGLSRSVLYRMFEPDGGFESYVRRSRLDIVLRNLNTQAPAHGIISATARQMGFHDPVLFTKQFRRQFGCAPSDVVGAALENPLGEDFPATIASDKNFLAPPSLQSVYAAN
jgi:AraC-like DNA-binding protein